MEDNKPQTVNENISQALKKFNVTDVVIEELKKNYLPLVVKDVNDKEGLALVHDARMTIRDLRIEVEKKGKELKADALAFQRAVNAEEKRIVAELTAIEDHLQEQEDIVKKEKERIEKLKEEERKKRLQERIVLITSKGMFFNGHTYTFANLSIDNIQLEIIDDDDWIQFIERLNLSVENEALRKQKEEEEKAKLQVELDKQKAEQEELAKKLAEQQRLLDEQAAKLKEESDKINAENKKREDEKRKVRTEWMNSIGMSLFGDTFLYQGNKEIAILQFDIMMQMSDADFQKYFEDAQNKINEFVAAEEKRKEKERADRIAEEDKKKHEAFAKAEARKPDRAKIKIYFQNILAVEKPVLKQEDMKIYLEDFTLSLKTFIEEHHNTLEK